MSEPQSQFLEAPKHLHTLMLGMVNTQAELNCKFVGDNWQAVALLRERVDYGCAILEEGYELQKCDPSWKWWKSNHPTPDLSNMKIELVDLLHFHISDALSTEVFVDSEPPTLAFPSFDQVATEMVEGYLNAYDLTPLDDNIVAGVYSAVSQGGYSAFAVRRALHALISSALAGVNSSEETYDLEEPPLGALEDEPLGNAYASVATTNWTAFWSVAYHAGLSFNDVYQSYCAKAVLNSFRIANGDKAGTYHRHWFDQQEDNYYLMQFYQGYALTNNGAAPSVEETLTYLTTAYTSFKAQFVTSTSATVVAQ